MRTRKINNKKNSLRKFGVPKYILDALEVLRPPEKINVSEWAAKYRFLDERSSAMPGLWKNRVTPYLAGIMDEFGNWQTEKIVFCKPTQVGGTEALNNMLAYCVAQDPAPAMIVEPTQEMADSFSDNRLVPMFERSPVLRERFRKNESHKNELQFEGSYIALTGSNSPAGLSSKPIKYLFLDEVDKYPPSTKKEADPVALAIERTKTFPNRKIYMCSTPTTAGGKIWKEKESCDVEKHFFVPCPHCKKMIELKFKQIIFPSDEAMTYADRADRANYVCQECGGVIKDSDKAGMLQDGEWRIVKNSPKAAKSVAYWLNTLYSPFTRFSDIARAFLYSKDDAESFHNFTNSWLAEPWEEFRAKLEPEIVKARETELEEFIVPSWAKMITGGVDVQQASLYYVVRAWGDHMTSQLITRGQALSFAEIERAMNRSYRMESGERLSVNLCLIDSGDQTDDVYDFAMRNSEWCLPCKGVKTMFPFYKISTINKAGSRACGTSLVLVDGGKYKDGINQRMRKENGKGSFMVFKDIDMEYCNQLTSEHKVLEQTGSGGERYRWKPKRKHIDNHFLDCEVYAMAAADVLGVRTLFLQAEEEEIQNAQPRAREEAHTERENSFNANEWLKEDLSTWL